MAGLVYRPREGDTDYECLIMRMPTTPTFYKGIWCAPGGGVEITDSLIQCRLSERWR